MEHHLRVICNDFCFSTAIVRRSSLSAAVVALEIFDSCFSHVFHDTFRKTGFFIYLFQDRFPK